MDGVVVVRLRSPRGLESTTFRGLQSGRSNYRPSAGKQSSIGALEAGDAAGPAHGGTAQGQQRVHVLISVVSEGETKSRVQPFVSSSCSVYYPGEGKSHRRGGGKKWRVRVVAFACTAGAPQRFTGTFLG